MDIRHNQSFHILLVEDNAADAFLIMKALKDSGYNIHVDVVPGGEEVVEFLRGGEMQLSVLIPDLIILDLVLPGKNGYEVLKEIKNDPRLKTIPVVVFTGSGAPEDVKKVYELGANSYVVKPIEFEDLQRSLRTIQEFWFGVARLPDNPKI